MAQILDDGQTWITSFVLEEADPVFACWTRHKPKNLPIMQDLDLVALCEKWIALEETSLDSPSLSVEDLYLCRPLRSLADPYISAKNQDFWGVQSCDNSVPTRCKMACYLEELPSSRTPLFESSFSVESFDVVEFTIRILAAKNVQPVILHAATVKLSCNYERRCFLPPIVEDVVSFSASEILCSRRWFYSKQ